MRLRNILLDIINIDFNEKHKPQEDKIKKDAIDIVKFLNKTILRQGECIMAKDKKTNEVDCLEFLTSNPDKYPELFPEVFKDSEKK